MCTHIKSWKTRLCWPNSFIVFTSWWCGRASIAAPAWTVNTHPPSIAADPASASPGGRDDGGRSQRHDENSPSKTELTFLSVFRWREVIFFRDAFDSFPIGLHSLRQCQFLFKGQAEGLNFEVVEFREDFIFYMLPDDTQKNLDLFINTGFTWWKTVGTYYLLTYRYVVGFTCYTANIGTEPFRSKSYLNF